MDTWHNRLDSTLSERGKTWKDLFMYLHAKTGISKPSVYAWKPLAKARTEMMNGDNAAIVCAWLSINSDWLFTGKGLRDLSPSSDTKIELNGAKFDTNVTSVPFGLRPIPVISYVQAGLLTDISDPYAPGDGFATEICEDDLGRFAFALEIEGNSMLPDFRPGDRIIVDPDVSPMPGDFVVAKNGKQMATFKKYRPRGMNEQGQQVFELIPLNEDYPTMRSDIEHLRIIGTMVEHRKKYRRKS